MSKISLEKFGKEAINAGELSAGLIAGSFGLKQINKMAAGKIPAWATPILLGVIGFATTAFVENDHVKNIGKGVMLAGVLDGAKQAITKIQGTQTDGAVAQLNAAIPSLSGLHGEYINYEQVAVPMLNQF